MSIPLGTARDTALELYEAAVVAADPALLTARAIESLSIERDNRVWIFAFGKAAHAMASATVRSLLRSLHAIVGGVVVTPDEAPSPYPTLVAMRGDHPVPGANSFAAAAKIAEVAQGRRGSDVAIVLISGGASSLIGAPLSGMKEGDLAHLYELLMSSGLDIAEMNIVRKRFSRWGAGRLALALAPAATHCLALSDVVGDDLSIIGSGPCSPDATTVKDVVAILERAGIATKVAPSQREYLSAVSRRAIPETPNNTHPAFAHISARVIGNNRSALDGAAAEALSRGMVVDVIDTPLEGDAAEAGEAIARRLLELRAEPGTSSDPRCLIWGGETTVASRGHDRRPRPGGGGRCQELALAAARVLAAAGSAADGITVLAAGTDGRDGATDAAGACVDSTTISEIVAAGHDPVAALEQHESYGALLAANALIPRRDTGTNVADIVIGIVN